MSVLCVIEDSELRTVESTESLQDVGNEAASDLVTAQIVSLLPLATLSCSGPSET